MTWLVIKFILLSAAIVVIGTFLTRFADRLGELTGMGRSLAGALLLALATSLPELAVGAHAVRIPAPDLAVGDLMGSCLFNVLILAVLDLMHRQRGTMFSPAASRHALSAIATMALLALTATIMVIGQLTDVQWGFGRISGGSVLILAVYGLLIRMIYRDGRANGDDEATDEDTMIEGLGLRAAVIGYLLATLGILATAPPLAITADEIAKQTGLGGTFVGTMLVALVTSLPEITTSISALRIGAYDMIVGNIFGSNAFNIVCLAGIDLFTADQLLSGSSLSMTHILTAAMATLTTATVAMGMLYRVEKRLWILEPDALLVILQTLVALWLVYAFS